MAKGLELSRAADKGGTRPIATCISSAPFSLLKKLLGQLSAEGPAEALSTWLDTHQRYLVVLTFEVPSASVRLIS